VAALTYIPSRNVLAGPQTFIAPAQINSYPECPPNVDTIWVKREFFGSGDIVNVPFEYGFDDSDADGSGPAAILVLSTM
jgi:hypothetical protein